MSRRPMIFSAVVVGAMFLLSAWAWTQLPADAQVPIHWGIDGTPDGYASKAVGLFLLPMITAGIALLLAVIPRFEPRRANLERSGQAYAVARVGVVSVLGLVHVVAIAAALGSDIDMTRIVMITTGALFIGIGNYMPKMRPNFTMGIRTPWTLSSDRSWDRTHRLGGRLFVLEGAVFVILGVLGVASQFLIGAIIVGIVLVIVVAFAYSYLVWKDDPAKRTS
jgi:uncharacterized membrane protein